MFTDSVNTAILEKALSATWQRGQVIAHNMANEDTPGYKAKRLEFESLLQKEINQSSSMRYSTFSKCQQMNRISALQPVVYTDKTTSTKADGNNVDPVNEEIEAARVQLQYQALRDRINGHYTTMKYAISGGGN